MKDIDIVADRTKGATRGVIPFSNLVNSKFAVDEKQLNAAYADVGPDTLAKILFTSGSTSDPKGVPQTQAMMCVNQAQYLACPSILQTKPLQS
jgi:feruloyl-CoA synthase